jgi:hypothetical protein
MSASLKGNYNARSIKIEVTDLELNITTNYDSISAAVKGLNNNPADEASIYNIFISNVIQFEF